MMCKTFDRLIQFLPYDPQARLRLLALFVLISGVGALAFAYTMQYGFGLRPCILCLYQRWPYRLAIGLALLALFLSRVAPRYIAYPIALAAPVFFSGTLIGFYQVGVEQHWWTGTEECTGARLTNLSPDQLLEKISAAPLVRCDEIQFSLFGISMAGYNALLSLGLSGFVIAALLLIRATRATHPH